MVPRKHFWMEMFVIQTKKIDMITLYSHTWWILGHMALHIQTCVVQNIHKHECILYIRTSTGAYPTHTYLRTSCTHTYLHTSTCAYCTQCSHPLLRIYWNTTTAELLSTLIESLPGLFPSHTPNLPISQKLSLVPKGKTLFGGILQQIKWGMRTKTRREN